MQIDLADKPLNSCVWFVSAVVHAPAKQGSKFVCSAACEGKRDREDTLQENRWLGNWLETRKQDIKAEIRLWESECIAFSGPLNWAE